METIINKALLPDFKAIKILKKEQLTKNVFLVELEVSEENKAFYEFEAGQFVTIEFEHLGEMVYRDYSIVNAPNEKNIQLAIKIQNEKSTANSLFQNIREGDFLKVSKPQGRFTIKDKPNEKRTILGFATGIGITPIYSHLQHILWAEKNTRFFLFYSNPSTKDIVFKKELDALVQQYEGRLEVHYFTTQEKIENPFYQGRIDEVKLDLIINQILHLDENDEETTIWDEVDEVLICGKGEMIKSIANACFNNGMRKNSIYYELFENFNDTIFEPEQKAEIIQNIEVSFVLNGEKKENILLETNEEKILQQLLKKGYKVPYSCKSGLCGACRCKLEEGEVEMLENEYLTDSEVEENYILPCSSIALSTKIFLNFDEV